MALEETVKSMAALSVDDRVGIFPNPILKGKRESKPEQGGIVAEEDSSEPAAGNKSAAIRSHPLEHASTILPPNRSKRLVRLHASYLHIPHCRRVLEGKLASGVDFYCFKDSIEPKWEDPICANGGKWTINFTRGKSDTAWLYTGDEICGAVVNVRGRQEKDSLWTTNASNEAAQISIGKQ